MEFKMNNMTWGIKEVSQEALKLLDNGEDEDNKMILGLTCFDKQEIYLWEKLKWEQKRRTLIHELVHCYKGNYLSFEGCTISEEMMCDLIANSHDIIHSIVKDYEKYSTNWVKK